MECKYRLHQTYDGVKAVCPCCKARKEKLISQKDVEATNQSTVVLLRIANNTVRKNG